VRELARIKLDEIAAGRLVCSLDAGERRAVQVLDDYRLRVAALAERREGLLAEIAQAQAQRDDSAEAVEASLAAVEAIRTDTEDKVQASPAWQAAKRALDEAEAVASEAEKKAASSESELATKRKPYDDDPLFVYLWQRKFGTREYEAGNFVRFMDRLVSDFVGYEDARLNYAALIEIPLRLREHAAAKRAEAQERRAALEALERRAMIEAGSEPKERALAEARHKLAAADRTLEGKNELLRKLDDERKAVMADGSNPAYSAALETVSAADSKDEIAELYREARRTHTDADDAIVRRIESIDQILSKTEGEVRRLRGAAEELARRRAEVQQVRDRFRQAGYDHPHATFGNDNAISEVLGRVLEGVVNSGVLWDVLKGGYRYGGPRRRSGFGGPQFPFPFPIPGGGGTTWPGGGWREPTSRGGWWPSDRDGNDDDRGWRGDDGGSDPRSRDDNDRFTTGGSF
jgi:hypothetical protein